MKLIKEFAFEEDHENLCLTRIMPGSIKMEGVRDYSGSALALVVDHKKFSYL